MKRNTPLITLLTGAALGIVLLIASMLATPSNAPAGYSASTTPAPASTTPVAPSSTAPSSAAVSPSAPSASAPSPSAPASTAYASAPTQADYAGKVSGGGASVAVSVHGSQVIAYVCNGSTVEAWLKGTVKAGRVVMTGKNHAQLSADSAVDSAVTMMAGDVTAHGTHYSFSVPMAQKPSGLYEATATVRGATIKAGWIVLADGTQVGSLETDAGSAAPSAIQAPRLDVATGTAEYDGTILHATLISGATGSGF